MVIHLSLATGSYLYTLNHADPTLTILAFCKMRIYILQSTGMMYRWYLTMACFDRFALSSANVRLRNVAKVRVACRVVLVIVPVWIILPVHTLIFYSLKGGSCGIFVSIAAALYHSLFTTITGCVLPVSIMATFALLTHRNLVLKQQRRQQIVNQPPEGRNRVRHLQRKQDQQVLLMLLVQVAIYAVSITPLMAFYFYNAVSLYIPNKPPERLAAERFAQFVAETIAFLFPVLSFYLYTMTSHSFRDELVRLLRSVATCRWYGNNPRIEPMTTDTGQRRITGNETV